jgi:hypothetical protein
MAFKVKKLKASAKKLSTKTVPDVVRSTPKTTHVKGGKDVVRSSPKTTHVKRNPGKNLGKFLYPSRLPSGQKIGATVKVKMKSNKGKY